MRKDVKLWDKKRDQTSLENLKSICCASQKLHGGVSENNTSSVVLKRTKNLMSYVFYAKSRFFNHVTNKYEVI